MPSASSAGALPMGGQTPAAAPMDPRFATGMDTRPVPDPTFLTTQQLYREMAALKELIVTRLDDMDKAITLLQDAANRSPSINEVYLQHAERFKSVVSALEQRDSRTADVFEAHKTSIVVAMEAANAKLASVGEMVDHLRALHDEKFRSVTVQFSERDTRAERASKDSKVAVDAALQAAKEAVGEQNKSSALAIAKSEAATTKQIDQIQLVINANTKGSDDKIEDIKQRLTVIESKKAGGSEMWGVMTGVVGLVIGIIGIVVAVVSTLRGHP